LMGADPRIEKARTLWASITERCAYSAYSAHTPPTVTRRDLHNWNRRAFPTATELDPIIELLGDLFYLCAPTEQPGRAGRGHKSPQYLVNRLALAAAQSAPRTHCAQRTHSEAGSGTSAHSADSAHSPEPADDEDEDRGDAWEGEAHANNLL